jgi:peroxiredoxin
MTVAFGVAEPGAEKSPRKSVLIGPDGQIVQAYDTVVPAEHPDQVLADLG